MKKHISILVPDGAAVIGCIEGALKTFRIANAFLEQRGTMPMFTIQLVALTKSPRSYDGCFTVQPDGTIATVPKTDLIIIPPVNGNMDEVIALNSKFFPWIREQHAAGAEVASLCVGAFLLAGNGIAEREEMFHTLVRRTSVQEYVPCGGSRFRKDHHG
jgi:transcriptional regulator GlxA family with amidase domain